MKRFMDKDFLLTTPTARTLYHDWASKLPIMDYHCHVSPKEIYENRVFHNLTELWLEGDHYKWRLMRNNGVEEFYITGEASDWEKFYQFAKTLPKAIGNPVYHWCHMELRKYFDYEGILNEKTAELVWKLTEEKLRKERMSVRDLIETSNVVFIGTTDDPLDSLEWHLKLQGDPTMKTKVVPTFRPDRAFHIQKTEWNSYLDSLGELCKRSVSTWKELKEVLRLRMEFFQKCGCRASDHGLEWMVYQQSDETEVEEIFQKGRRGDVLTKKEEILFQSALLEFCGREYARIGWVMQLHLNCLRNPNTKMFQILGPDTGYDCIGPHNGSRSLAQFMDTLEQEGCLPRMILYSLDAGDNAFLDVLSGSFSSEECPGKIQHGAAWWFQDHKRGIEVQLESLSNLGVLGNFIGMLTDSRSFLSYVRHEYFRRILCNLIGKWMENGEYPADMETVTRVVEDICYRNAARFFA